MTSCGQDGGLGRSWAWVPPQTTRVGSEGHYPEEGPAREASVGGFWMQKHQVTNDQFAAFVSGNPDITLSAGLLFTKHRYPIARAAEDAGRVLERSKEKKWTDATGKKRSRDHLTVLGDTFRWREAPDIFGEIEKLMARSEFLTSAFLYDLVEYSRLYRLWADEGKIEGLRYKALFAYNIARNLRKGDEYIFQWADALMQSLHGGQESLTMRHLGLMATYVLFSKRGRQND